MYQVSDVTGAVLHSSREYDIAPETVVTPGQLVKLSGGKVVPADKGETGAVLGVALEAHSGQEDALDPRGKGRFILVADSPTAVLACPAPVLKATGGTATTVTASAAAFTANVFKGGFIKGPDGHLREITASSVASGVLTLTVEEGAVSKEGDEITVFPPRGFSAGNLTEDGRKLALSATAALPLMVMGRDEGKNEIWLVCTKHCLAAAR